MLANSHYRHNTITMESIQMLWENYSKLKNIWMINKTILNSYENHSKCLYISIEIINKII